MPLNLKYNFCEGIFLINPDFFLDSLLCEVGRKVSCSQILISS
jgi:hypothetical protein